jgi:hypothetical protein
VGSDAQRAAIRSVPKRAHCHLAPSRVCPIEHEPNVRSRACAPSGTGRWSQAHSAEPSSTGFLDHTRRRAYAANARAVNRLAPAEWRVLAPLARRWPAGRHRAGSAQRCEAELTWGSSAHRPSASETLPCMRSVSTPRTLSLRRRARAVRRTSTRPTIDRLRDRRVSGMLHEQFRRCALRLQPRRSGDAALASLARAGRRALWKVHHVGAPSRACGRPNLPSASVVVPDALFVALAARWHGAPTADPGQGPVCAPRVLVDDAAA